jgi:hypothetical protein
LKDCVDEYSFVCRSDVNSYYATVDHAILRKQLAQLISASDSVAHGGAVDESGAWVVKMTKHPFKTLIGRRIKESGFDFLGYRIVGGDGGRLRVAWKAWVNHQCRVRLLYEQGASEECIGGYVESWLRWVGSGVSIDLVEALKGFRVWGCRAEAFYCW